MSQTYASTYNTRRRIVYNIVEFYIQYVGYPTPSLCRLQRGIQHVTNVSHNSHVLTWQSNVSSWQSIIYYV